MLGARTEVKYEDLNKLHYTHCVYKETLRLWPPIPEIARFTRKDIKINDVAIPKNSWLQVSTYVSGRTDKYFNNPAEFRPERFTSITGEGDEYDLNLKLIIESVFKMF